MGTGVTDRGITLSGNNGVPDPVMRVCILDRNVTVPEIRCIEMRCDWLYLFLTHVFTPVFVMRAKTGHPRSGDCIPKCSYTYSRVGGQRASKGIQECTEPNLDDLFACV